jgi:uncharacterized protein (TIGR04255 family)
MTKSPDDLPSFSRPPLNEVVLSIQFASLTELKGIDLGLFWQKVKKRYPDVSEQPVIQAAFETFGTPQLAKPAFRLESIMTPPMPRYWFEKAGSPDLLQIQHDRIIHNWRGGDDVSTYPRYPAVKAKLSREIEEFEKWLDASRLGRLLPNQCEVTYTNLIDFDDSDQVHSDLRRLTPLWSGIDSTDEAVDFEDVAINTRRVFTHNGRSAGRVYAQFLPVFRQSDLRPMIKLEITARGRPDSETVDEALSFLDVEHEEVVRTFADLTSPEMHKMWGRKDGKRTK